MGPSVSRAFGIRLAEPKWPINNWLLCSAGRLHSLRAGGRRKKNAKVKDARARTHARTLTKGGGRNTFGAHSRLAQRRLPITFDAVVAETDEKCTPAV